MLSLDESLGRDFKIFHEVSCVTGAAVSTPTYGTLLLFLLLLLLAAFLSVVPERTHTTLCDHGLGLLCDERERQEIPLERRSGFITHAFSCQALSLPELSTQQHQGMFLLC